MLELIYKLLWYYLIFGFLGWVAEVIYAACTQRKFVNKGFLSAPFCPIYGIGVAVVTLLLGHFRDNLPLFLLGAIVVCSILELGTGFLLEKSFHTRWWNHSEGRFHLFGYVSLGFSVLWGLAATFIVRVMLPVLDTVLLDIPSLISLIVIIGVNALLLADFSVTAGAVVGINKQAKQLAGTAKRLKEIGAALKASQGNAKTVLLAEQQALLAQYEGVLSQVGPVKRRIFQAFPEMRNTRHSKEVTELQYGLNKFAEDAKAFAGDVEVKHKKLVLETYENRLPHAADRPFAYGLCFQKVFILFVVGNVVGCILETLYTLAVLRRFEMRVGLVYGPFIPVYGFGAVLMTLCLYKFYKARDLWIFAGSLIIGMSFEYFASYFQEKLLGTVSWDYTGTFMNIDGRTNLLYGLMWGLLGLVWVKDIYPLISKGIEKIPKKFGSVATIVLAIFFAYDVFMSCAAISRQNERRGGIAPQNTFAVYLDNTFDDAYMQFIFPYMRDAETGVTNVQR